MYFSAAFLSTLVSFAVAALTVDEVVTDIGVVTDLSAELRDTLSPLTLQSTGGEVQATTQTTMQQFEVIIQDLNSYVPAMQSTPPFDATGGSTVAPVFKDFVQMQQDMLSVVIDKHSIMAQFGSTPPYASMLRVLEGSLDAFTLSLMNLIPTEQSTVQEGGAELENTVSAAITKYQQTCVPNPSYPDAVPTCFNAQ